MPQYDYDNAPVYETVGEQPILGKYLLDVEKELMELRRNWFGLKVNPNFGKLIPGTKEIDYRDFIHDNENSILNEMGSNMLYSELVAELNKIVSVSNVDEDVIIKEVIDFHNTFNELVARGHLEFNLNVNFQRPLVSKAVRLVKAAWYASKGGLRMKYTLQPGVQKEIIQNNTEYLQQKKPKSFGFIGGN